MRYLASAIDLRRVRHPKFLSKVLTCEEDDDGNGDDAITLVLSDDTNGFMKSE